MQSWFALVLLLGWAVSTVGFLIIFPDPTPAPTIIPTAAPSFNPTINPTAKPTFAPSQRPTSVPSSQPSRQPTRQPTSQPSGQPVPLPTGQPTRQPSSQPSQQPSSRPSGQPTVQPSRSPSGQPSGQPTSKPSSQPVAYPTSRPTNQPTMQPSGKPTRQPSGQPSGRPSLQPSAQPSGQPSSKPTTEPSRQPSAAPSAQPSSDPTSQPSRQPSSHPSTQPSARPSGQPSGWPSSQPSNHPSSQPTVSPTCQPSAQPSSHPSRQSTSRPSGQPSRTPSGQPSTLPTSQPSVIPSSQPSARPSRQPSSQPTGRPSSQPSTHPSAQPSARPTSQPSSRPTSQPSAIPSRQPSAQPSSRPSSQPTTCPSAQPSRSPSAQPSTKPTRQPSGQPTNQPSVVPSSQPSGQPSGRPSSQPSAHPSAQPSSSPTAQPSCLPTAQPSSRPSSQPSGKPSSQPSSRPSGQPTTTPSVRPTAQPSARPSSQPSSLPTTQPSSRPSSQPSGVPSSQPSGHPSAQPSDQPSSRPSVKPSGQPSRTPSSQPSSEPSGQPSVAPTVQPSQQPSTRPSAQPSSTPSGQPTSCPSAQPVAHPSAQPTVQPSMQPSRQPSGLPSSQPSCVPSAQPSARPSQSPSARPSTQPSSAPSPQPSSAPSAQPSGLPSAQPSGDPSVQPSTQPSLKPSSQPSSKPSSQPTGRPSAQPSVVPSGQPSVQPTQQPTTQPSSIPSGQPSTRPSRQPTASPSGQPTTEPSVQPSSIPSAQPTVQPSTVPSAQPTSVPSNQPTARPTDSPSTQPSAQPTSLPSVQPSSRPSSQPSARPSSVPSAQPTSLPSCQPTQQPTSQPSGVPSAQPVFPPTADPTQIPTSQPSVQPSSLPSSQPSGLPSVQPSAVPSAVPSAQPAGAPTSQPSAQPSAVPSSQPVMKPSSLPTGVPSSLPSAQPSALPSSQPSARPSVQPTSGPTSQPSSAPSAQPSVQPSGQPSGIPSSQPSEQPSAQPSGAPSAQPSHQPSSRPSVLPSGQPSSRPTCQPSSKPSAQPSCQPTLQPSTQPTDTPSGQPSGMPTEQPSSQPTTVPSAQPTSVPSTQPSALPSTQPSVIPSAQPSSVPTDQPSAQPSTQPSGVPSSQPSAFPSVQPSVQPTGVPSTQPSTQPSAQPSCVPSGQPSVQPTAQPSQQPSAHPSAQPSSSPSMQPTAAPSSQPTVQPSAQPSSLPSAQPSVQPTNQPSVCPSSQPTRQPSVQPTVQPSSQPSVVPSTQPTAQPSSIPTAQPSSQPSAQPSEQPTSVPTQQPSSQPTTQPSALPSAQPSSQPSVQPSSSPSAQPSVQPTGQPTEQPTAQPTGQPTLQPSSQPTTQPTSQPSSAPSTQPSSLPSSQPSAQPSGSPSSQPTEQPTSVPSGQPTMQPSAEPSVQPTGVPTTQPSSVPSAQPSGQPSVQPTALPSVQPSTQPSVQPTAQPSVQPSTQPSTQPSSQPSDVPSGQPSNQPSSRPTKCPSTQPSSEPTSQPSSQPSCQPSSQPSVQPSAQPSSLPSSAPSGQPSSRPSSQPTIQPSGQPSSQPVLVPTAQPSSQPTQPSSQPTEQPSGQPSRQPTSQPSALPSAQPSRQPSMQPTSQPSARPTSQPTNQPSSQPSGQPTSRPTGQPSSQPSAQPSSQPVAVPTGQPSGQPSSQPSSQPAGYPSSQPSSQPSSRPSQQPSAQPTVRPTSGRPTSVPSGRPSMAPVTTHPTLPGDTNPPTSHPTAAPSYDMDYMSHFTYRDYLLMKAQYETVPTSFTFGSYYFKGVTVGGQCSNWMDYSAKQLQLPSDEVIFTSVTTDIERYNFITRAYDRTAVTCSTAKHVNSILYSLKYSTSYVALCDDYTWRVYQCNGKNVLCVNCKMSCVKSEACPGTGLVVGTCTACQNRAAAITMVNVKYSTIKLYPLFARTPLVSAQRTSIDVTVNITKAGYVYCAAFPSGTVLRSVVDVYQNGTSYAVSSAFLVTSLTLGNLAPDTAYDVYCYTNDFANHIMSLDDAKLTKVPVRTSCCRALLMVKSFESVVQYAPSSARTTATDRAESAFAFALDSAPTAALEVDLTGALVDCTTLAVLSSVSSQIFVPQTFSFAANAKVLKGEFLVRATAAGCLQITATAFGANSYQPVSSVVRVTSLGSQPAVPKLVRVSLSTLGTAVLFDFDLATDMGVSKVSNYATAFACSQLVTFPGSAQASCKWLNATRVEADLTLSTIKASIGDWATFRGSTVRAKCVPNTISCTSYSYVAATTLPISLPYVSLLPKAVIYAPQVIWTCDALTLDPTASYGFVGRKWESVRWTVKGSGMAENKSAAVEAYLNLNYPDTTQVAVVPNGLLTQATLWVQSGYEIRLNVTNFLFKSSVVKVVVNVAPNLGSVVPQVRLFGVNQIKFRGVALSLFVSAVYPACVNNASAPALQYRWRAYLGKTLVPSITSGSLDPRYFKLDPYTLEASSTYTIAVDVLVKSVVVATSSGFVLVGRAGVQAAISGGNIRTVNTASKVFDASLSRDVDYPTAPLTYSWSCKVYSPSFGDACAGFAPSNAVTREIAAGTLAPRVYTLTVTVANAAGQTSSADILLTVVDARIPEIKMVTQQARYNEDTKIIITGEVSAPLGVVQAMWSSSNSLAEDTQLSPLTPVAAALKQGQSVFQLALPPYALLGGRSYTFILQAKYPSSVANGTASIEISVNGPPIGGTLTVSPATGTALSTIYLIRSSYWEDDEGDLPLTHVIAYYLLRPMDLIVVKVPDEVSYVSTVLGQGLLSLNYLVTCFVRVSDCFGVGTNVSTPVTVNPALSTTLSVASARSAMASALFLADPTALTQVIGATAVAINSVNCAVLVACGSINRVACQSTAQTCGQCLSGYVGVDGDSNIACSRAASVLPIGSICRSDSTCITKLCVGGRCANVLKSCAGNCGSGGLCRYIDAGGNDVDQCFVSDSSCRAQCDCRGTGFGSDCALKAFELAAYQQLREDLCSSVRLTVALQDASADVISSRAVLVSNILLESDQISDAALYNCTTALVESVVQNPVMSCAMDGMNLVAAALSAVLQRGTRLSAELQGQVSSALVALSEGCQTYAAIREAPMLIENDNIRFLAAVADRNTITSLALSAPLSAFEVFTKAPTSSVDFSSASLNGAEMLGVSLLVYKNDPRSIATNSTQFGVLLSNATAASGETSARRLATTSTTSEVGFTMVLQNNVPIHFGVVTNQTLEFRCFQQYQSVPYYITGVCPSGLELNYTCPVNAKGTYVAECPTYVTAPRCTSFNGANYEVDRNCTVVAYNPYNTTCYCTVGRSTSSRRSLQGANSELLEFSTAYGVVHTPYSEFYLPAPPIVGMTQAVVVAASLGGIGLLFLLGLVLFIGWDQNESDKYSVMEKKNPKPRVRTVNSFFDALFPDELRDGPWYLRFWNQMLLEHPWLCLYAPQYETSTSRTVKWAVAIGSLLVFLFINSLVAFAMYADDGHCEMLIFEHECLSYETTGGYFTACKWRADNESCEFKPKQIKFQTLIILTLIVGLLSLPFQQFWRYCVHHVHSYYRAYRARRQVKDVAVSPRRKRKYVPLRHDEFHDVQTRHATLLRAARLAKARDTMDKVTAIEEASSITVAMTDDDVFWDNNVVFGDVVVGHVHFERTRYGSELKSRQHVLDLVHLSRSRAELIQGKITTNFDPQAQEEIMMKHFIIDVFTGYKRRIVSKYFLGHANVLHRELYAEYQQIFCLVALPCYAALMLYFTIDFNFSIGTRSTSLWLVVTVLSILQAIVLLEPTKIWIVWVLINIPVGAEVRAFCESLSMKSRLILRRTSGLMRDSNAMVQHFNPACRVARMHPALPISRLLMSVNDRDLPLQRVRGWYFLLLDKILFAVHLLPEVLQDALLYVFAITIIDLFLIAIVSFGMNAPIPAIVVLTVVFGGAIFYLFDGANNTRAAVQWCATAHHRSTTVVPLQKLYEEYFVTHVGVEARADLSDIPEENEESEEEGPDVKEIYELDEGVENSAGLFHKHEKVQVNEHQWRTIAQRLTPNRAFRGLQEMNRKFNIVAPVDEDFFFHENPEEKDNKDDEVTYHEHQSHSNKEWFAVAAKKTSPQSQNSPGLGLGLSPHPAQEIAKETREKPRLTISAGGFVSSTSKRVVEAFKFNTQQHRASTGSGPRRVSPFSPLSSPAVLGAHTLGSNNPSQFPSPVVFFSDEESKGSQSGSPPKPSVNEDPEHSEKHFSGNEYDDEPDSVAGDKEEHSPKRFPIVRVMSDFFKRLRSDEEDNTSDHVDDLSGSDYGDGIYHASTKSMDFA